MCLNAVRGGTYVHVYLSIRNMLLRGGIGIVGVLVTDDMYSYAVNFDSSQQPLSVVFH